MTETAHDTSANGAASGFKPPYGSFATMNNLFDRMAEEGGVPARLDRSYLSNLPGSVIATTTQTLKALELTDEDLHPTPTLIEIVENPSQRKSLLAGIIRDKYRPQLELGSRATTQQLEKSFRDLGVSGSTVRKAIAFFLAAARYADVSVSPYFKTPKPPLAAEGKKMRRAEGSNAPRLEFQASPPPSSGLHPFVRGLIESLPAAGTEWPDDKREEWLTAARAAFNLMYLRPPEEVRLTLTPSSREGDND